MINLPEQLFLSVSRHYIPLQLLGSFFLFPVSTYLYTSLEVSFCFPSVHTFTALGKFHNYEYGHGVLVLCSERINVAKVDYANMIINNFSSEEQNALLGLCSKGFQHHSV